MLLSDRDIRGCIEDGDLMIEPYDESLVQPASIDVRLSGSFLRPLRRLGQVDTRHPGTVAHEVIPVAPRQPFALVPGEFILGSTLETVTVSDAIAVELTGKSSLARMGLLVHHTAGWVDPGFEGQITLELMNVGPSTLLLWPGDPIAQLVVWCLSTPCETPYGERGRYQGQQGPTAARAANLAATSS